MSKNKGFTLIEILTVVAIILILSGLGFFSYRSAQIKARDSKRISDLREIQKLLENCYEVNNSYPVGKDISFVDCPATFPNDPFQKLHDAQRLGFVDYYYSYLGQEDHYYLRAKLETGQSVLETDVDGVVNFDGNNTLDCDDSNGKNFFCIYF